RASESSGKDCGHESSGKDCGHRVVLARQWAPGSSGIGLSGSTAGIGSPGMTGGHWVTRHQVICLASGTASFWQGSGHRRSPGTGSSGSTAGIDVQPGLIGKCRAVDQFHHAE
ncbi:unnamed protein product, partial [Staurois parvus]